MMQLKEKRQGVVLNKTPNTIEEAYAMSIPFTDRTSFCPRVPTPILMGLPATEINRDFKSRVKKQKKNFDKRAESSLEVTVFVVEGSFDIEVLGRKVTIAYTFSIGDANTRLEYWRSDPSYVPPTVTVKFVHIKNAEQYLNEYYSYDSTDSVETTNNKITGGCNLLNIDLRTTRGKKGTFGEALRYAYPTNKASAIEMLTFFAKELPIVDKYVMNVDSPELRQQTSTLTCAFLIALKIYGKPAEQKQQLIAMMKKLSQIKKDKWQIDTHPNNDNANKLDGAQWIMREALYFNFTEQGTKRSDYTNTLDFYLYCINNWMQNKFISAPKGMKNCNFEGKLEEAKDIVFDQWEQLQ